MKKLGTMALAGLMTVGLAACDTEPTAPAQDAATMEVVLYGDAESGSSAASQALHGNAAGEATGSVEVRARVYVQSNTRGWVELTNGAAARQTVGMASEAEGRVLTSSQVRAESYTRVRVVFEDVRAQVTGGLNLGTGLLQGEVRVGAQGGTTVEREVQFTVRSGTTSRLVIDLNAQTWLQRADTSTRMVGESEFRNAVAIRVR
jgi:hypothetical protein